MVFLKKYSGFLSRIAIVLVIHFGIPELQAMEEEVTKKQEENQALQKAAQKGHEKAQDDLMRRYGEGQISFSKEEADPFIESFLNWPRIEERLATLPGYAEFYYEYFLRIYVPNFYRIHFPNKEKAIGFAETAAKSNNPHALFFLGIMHEKNQDEKDNLLLAIENYLEATRWGHKKALNHAERIRDDFRFLPIFAPFISAISWVKESQDPEIIYRFAVIYKKNYNYSGSLEDYKKAAELYAKAAGLGHAAAKDAFHELFENIGEVWDLKKRGVFFQSLISVYNQETHKGDSRIPAFIAKAYQEGENVDLDIGKAAEFYLQAAELGDAVAKEAFYTLHEKINDIWNDDKRKAQFQALVGIYHQESAKGQGDRGLYTLLVGMHQEGHGHGYNHQDRDFGRAAECYLKLSELGDSEAKEAFYTLHEKIESLEYDEEKKAQFQALTPIYKKEAEKGEGDRRLYTILAGMYQKSHGSNNDDCDFGQAAECYLKAEKLGDPEAKEAFYNLYRAVRFGEDDQKGLAHFQVLILIYTQEAEKDKLNPRPHAILADIYLSCYFCSKEPSDLRKVAECYLKAAELGDPEAKESFYALHNIVGQFQIFLSIYQEEAAKGQGDRRLYTILAGMYQNGHGPNHDDRDFGKAARCYRKAAELGDSEAAKAFYTLHEKIESKWDLNKRQAQYKVLLPVYHEEAAKGKGDPQLYNILAGIYEEGHGDGVDRDFGKAAECYFEAGALGDVDAKEAFYNLHKKIESGWVWDKEKRQAQYNVLLSVYHQKAAQEKGYPRLYTILAGIYQEGHGRYHEGRDFGQAAKCYRQAGELGDEFSKEAFYKLHNKIESGWGKEKKLSFEPLFPFTTKRPQKVKETVGYITYLQICIRKVMDIPMSIETLVKLLTVIFRPLH